MSFLMDFFKNIHHPEVIIIGLPLIGILAYGVHEILEYLERNVPEKEDTNKVANKVVSSCYPQSNYERNKVVSSYYPQSNYERNHVVSSYYPPNNHSKNNVVLADYTELKEHKRNNAPLVYGAY